MERFEKQCLALLEAADRLLERYTNQRRRPGSSLAGRFLYPCLPMLSGLKNLYPPKEQETLRVLEAALMDRWTDLSRRRTPPSPALKRFQSKCQRLVTALPEIPKYWDSPSVLVGALRSPHQLDICRDYSFYHVPARYIPDSWLPFSYVAIYQSYTMFPDDCGVMLYGKVKSWKPVHRWQIRELPKNSDELYYQLEVESWQQLEPPIAIKEIPIVHLRTNLFLLTHSLDTPELTLRSPEHYVYYQALSAALTLGDGIVFYHPGGQVRHKSGLFQVHRYGRKIASFRTEDFVETPSAIFRELMDILESK